MLLAQIPAPAWHTLRRPVPDTTCCTEHWHHLIKAALFRTLHGKQEPTEEPAAGWQLLPAAVHTHPGGCHQQPGRSSSNRHMSISPFCTCADNSRAGAASGHSKHTAGLDSGIESFQGGHVHIQGQPGCAAQLQELQPREAAGPAESSAAGCVSSRRSASCSWVSSSPGCMRCRQQGRHLQGRRPCCIVAGAVADAHVAQGQL